MSGDNSFAHPVQFDQTQTYGQLNVETPEQVDLHFPVAGIGSRFLAILTDHIIQFAVVMLIFFVIYLAASASPQTASDSPGKMDTATKWGIALITLFFFLLFWGYFALFEAFWNGQTPGKRLLKIRVIKDSGRSITLFEAMARNLLRIVDYFPGMYLTGVITMLCNRSQKRLGDLVAGTIVVHERTDHQPMLASTHSSRSFTAHLYEQPEPVFQAPAVPTDDGLPADAVARLRPDDLHLIDTFFSRALDLSVEKREQLAERVAATLCGKMGVPRPEGMAAERMLEGIAYLMRGQGRF